MECGARVGHPKGLDDGEVAGDCREGRREGGNKKRDGVLLVASGDKF